MMKLLFSVGAALFPASAPPSRIAPQTPLWRTFEHGVKELLASRYFHRKAHAATRA
jgi:hypothetical protein